MPVLTDKQLWQSGHRCDTGNSTSEGGDSTGHREQSKLGHRVSPQTLTSTPRAIPRTGANRARLHEDCRSRGTSAFPEFPVLVLPLSRRSRARQSRYPQGSGQSLQYSPRVPVPPAQPARLRTCPQSNRWQNRATHGTLKIDPAFPRTPLLSRPDKPIRALATENVDIPAIHRFHVFSELPSGAPPILCSKGTDSHRTR